MSAFNLAALHSAYETLRSPTTEGGEYSLAAFATAIEHYLALAPTRHVKFPLNAEEAKAMELVGYAWLKQNAPEHLQSHLQERTVSDHNSKAVADGFRSKIDWIKAYRHERQVPLKEAKDAYESGMPFSAKPKPDPYRMLERCRTVLANMAAENAHSWLSRWPFPHEPLRVDARHLLPLINDVLESETPS